MKSETHNSRLETVAKRNKSDERCCESDRNHLRGRLDYGRGHVSEDVLAVAILFLK
jgi:hypothetical protein